MSQDQSLPDYPPLDQDQSSEDLVAKTLSSSTETTIDSFSWNSLDLNIEWLKHCLTCLNDKIVGFGNFSDSEKGKHIINRFLSSDMSLSCGGGDGMLPKDKILMVNMVLFFTVNEIKDMTYNPEHKLLGVPPGFNRVLMLSMTDGVQRVFGVEDKPIKDLQVFAPLGFKVAVDNVKVRDGFLMLEPGHLKVLGGVVKHLEAERQKSEKYIRRMQEWIKGTPTPDAWKPNGVGGVFMEENSTWHDAFSSRSDTQDPGVEKMDDIPSFQSKIEEKALPEPKEVEEDAAVPKNGDIELEESVGPQKEMAGVTDAGNAFRAKASLEQLNAIIKAAETTCAAADTTCETVLHQIDKIWDEVGQCERQRMLDELKQECLDVCRKKVDETVDSDTQLEQLQILPQIQQECFNVYQRKFDQEKRLKDILVKEMDLEKEKLTRLALVRGVRYKLPKKPAVLEKQFSDILIEVDRLQLLKDVREEKFADVQSQIQEILEELPEEAKVPIVEVPDLSWKSLKALKTQLLELQSSRVKFPNPNNKKLLETAESVVCHIRNQKMNGLKREKEKTHIETDPDAARKKITSLFGNSEEMLVQVKNWIQLTKINTIEKNYNVHCYCHSDVYFDLGGARIFSPHATLKSKLHSETKLCNSHTRIWNMNDAQIGSCDLPESEQCWIIIYLHSETKLCNIQNTEELKLLSKPMNAFATEINTTLQVTISKDQEITHT
ncbi:hypothetical protein MKX03_002200 [Papaver bracteatum]|nr:hypothetical protein MKX03_002200 [Papaver bracteatum]